jgi:predicted N-acetyltransferase YhbS
MEKSIAYRAFRDEDAEVVERLVESTFGHFMKGKFWKWKYQENPVFDSSLVVVAEDGGKIIGCNHWLRRMFKLSNSVEVTAVLGADIAVSPEYRDLGIGTNLLRFIRSTDMVQRSKLPMIYMFANPDLRKRFHTPVRGYVPAPDVTVTFTRILNWSGVKDNASSFNRTVANGKHGEKLDRTDLKVLFRVRSAPLLFLHINKSGVVVHEKEDAVACNHDLVVTSDVATLSILKGKKTNIQDVAKLFLTGKLRVRGKLTKIRTLYRNIWVLRELFGGKIT